MAGSTPRKYVYIDALRGIAFLGVFFCHVAASMTPGSGMPRFLYELLDGGFRAVPLFFLLSALTLFLSLDARKDEARPDRNFFIRRFFRIAPLFYSAAAFYLIAFPGYQNDAAFPVVRSPGSLIATLAFAHGWWPYWINQVVPGGWSIAVEMNFYLVVPLLYRRIRRLDAALLAALAAHLVGVACSHFAVPVYGRLLGAEPGSGAARMFAFFWLPNQMSAFFLGFVLYYCLKDHVVPEVVAEGDGVGTTRTRTVSLAMLVLAGYLYVSLARFNPGPLATLLTGVCCLLFTWSLALVPHRLFVNRATCLLGRLSFSGYITHFALLRWSLALLGRGGLPSVGDSWPVRLAYLSTVPLLATVALSYLTHRFIEIPGQGIGRRIIAWSERRSRRSSEGVAGPSGLGRRFGMGPHVATATADS